MALENIPQPEIVDINQWLRLRKYDGHYELFLPGYQNPVVYQNSEGIFEEEKIPNLDYVKGMCSYLSKVGELYYIEAKEGENFIPMGDVTVKVENPPIAIWFDSYRGKGIGTLVMKTVIDRLKFLGYEKITGSTVYKWNIPSQKLHEKLGFVKVGEDGDDILYELQLKETTTFVETSRLLLRKVTEEDYPYFRKYLMDREMDRLMLRFPCETEEDIRLGFEWFLHKEERAYTIVLKESGKVIGNLTVYNRVPEIVAAQDAVSGKKGKALSFSISPEFQRKGFMQEALCGVIDQLFHSEGADYINCGHLSYNTASKALQQKLGFTYLVTERFKFEGKEMESIENILWKAENKSK